MVVGKSRQHSEAFNELNCLFSSVDDNHIPETQGLVGCFSKNMRCKSSNLASVVLVALALVSPVLAQNTRPFPTKLLSWFGSCGAKKSMEIQIALNGEVIYRSSFPVCPIEDSSKEVQKTVVFSMKGGHVFQGEYHTSATQTIQGNIWQAGADPGVILFGISFASQKQILLNTIHIAKIGSESKTEIDRDFIVRTLPVRHEHLE